MVASPTELKKNLHFNSNAFGGKSQEQKKAACAGHAAGGTELFFFLRRSGVRLRQERDIRPFDATVCNG